MQPCVSQIERYTSTAVRLDGKAQAVAQTNARQEPRLDIDRETHEVSRSIEVQKPNEAPEER